MSMDDSKPAPKKRGRKPKNHRNTNTIICLHLNPNSLK